MTIINVAQLEAASEEVKAALAALRARGHPDSCACKLCFAGRRLVSAYNMVLTNDAGNGNGRE